MLKSVAVFCSSSEEIAVSYRYVAQELGQLLGKQKLDLIYGGGLLGLMGCVASGALAEGGKVYGFMTTQLMEKEKAHPHLTELHIVDSLHTRKKMMFEHAQAFIILPGGLGTFDEVFEILVWKQLAYHNKPIIFINTNQYWDLILTFLRHVAKERFMQPEHLDLFEMVSTSQEALNSLNLSFALDREV